MANVPGDQKLAPLSSADDERWPRKVANAITETRTSKLGKRFPEAIATSDPAPVQGTSIVDHAFK